MSWVKLSTQKPTSNGMYIVGWPSQTISVEVWNTELDRFISSPVDPTCWWMELPPVPKPDPFDEWWEKQLCVHGIDPRNARMIMLSIVNQGVARLIFQAGQQAERKK